MGYMCGQINAQGKSRVAHVFGMSTVVHEKLPSIAQVLLSNGINSEIETCGTTGPPAYGRQPEGSGGAGGQ
jgi:hypothetical protein